MSDPSQNAPLKSLHPEKLLNAGKLAKMRKMSTDAIVASLLPPSKDCLKTRRDGTILDGHHRIRVLRERGVAVDGLPRDIIEREPQNE